MISQAYKLVERLKCDPHVNFRKHWKMITILIGHNDICSHACDRFDLIFPVKDGSPKAYLKNIVTTLDILHRELPRTFVSLMPMAGTEFQATLIETFVKCNEQSADVTKVKEIYDKPLPCLLTHSYGCPCLFGIQDRLSLRETQYLMNAYFRGIEDLVNSGRYDTRKDFTVVIQPTLVQGTLPQHRPRRGSRVQPDLDYLSPDCFHWAQKLHAMGKSNA